MKKFLCFLLCLTLSTAFLCGCAKNNKDEGSDEPEHKVIDINPHDELLKINTVNEIIEKDANDTDKHEVKTSKDGKYTYQENNINGITILTVPEGTKGEFTFPSEIDGQAVTKIGKEILSSSRVTKITIPESVLIIDYEAFSQCPDLEEVLFKDGTIKIGDSVFLNDGNLKKVTLPKTLECLGPASFAGCFSLEEIYLPESLKEIDENCFNASGLKTVEIPSEIKCIKSYTFYGCKKLTSVKFRSMVYEIMDYAFAECTNLEIEISGCEKIYYNAFTNVKNAKYDKQYEFDPKQPAENSDSTDSK